MEPLETLRTKRYWMAKRALLDIPIVDGALSPETFTQVVLYTDAQAAIAALQAQLTQLDRTLADVYAQRDGLQKDLAQRTAALEAAKALIKTLPKVEGAVVVSNGYVKDSTRCHALFGADEDAALYAALLQHRQRMEG